MMSKPVVVVPTIRDEATVQAFVYQWINEFRGCKVIFVFDLPSVPKWFKRLSLLGDFVAYCHRDIDKDLGSDAWIIPRKTDCVRSYGFLKALELDPLFIVTLDDDTKPSMENHIEDFYSRLFQNEYPPSNFYNTLRGNDFPRGTYPSHKGCDVAHGGWLGVPDLSAEEQLERPFKSEAQHFNMGLVPKGSFFSMCGMNLAWKPGATRSLYFGLQGKDYPIDRCGDIWAGYKATIDGLSVHTGSPFVVHDRASNVWSNLEKEENAEKMSACFEDWASHDMTIKYHPEDYWDKLAEAYKVWERLVDERTSNSKV